MNATLFPIPADAIAVTSDECYTPRWVFDAMALRFDLDVAAPPGGAWHVPADRYYTAADDGLVQPWSGLVFCNPPYSERLPWAKKWATHPTGVLVSIYTPETYITPLMLGAADAVAFVSMKFQQPDGGVIKPRHGCVVAFRGVGVGPAQRLAAADRFGAVLYGRPRDDWEACPVNRDELIEAGARAIERRWGRTFPDEAKMTAAVVDAVEPLIRADERKPQIWHGVYRAGYDAALDALHAKVLMLPTTGKSPEDIINDVLALFDGRP